jgi:hypothetical protein
MKTTQLTGPRLIDITPSDCHAPTLIARLAYYAATPEEISDSVDFAITMLEAGVQP